MLALATEAGEPYRGSGLEAKSPARREAFCVAAELLASLAGTAIAKPNLARIDYTVRAVAEWCSVRAVVRR